MSSLEKDRQDLQSTVDTLLEGMRRMCSIDVSLFRAIYLGS